VLSRVSSIVFFYQIHRVGAVDLVLGTAQRDLPIFEQLARLHPTLGCLFPRPGHPPGAFASTASTVVPGYEAVIGLHGHLRAQPQQLLEQSSAALPPKARFEQDARLDLSRRSVQGL
jgi:hypothetical protein